MTINPNPKIRSETKMNANNTLYFKNVIGTYDEFLATQQAQDALLNIIVYQRTNGEAKVADVNFWGRDVYRILLRRFRNWEIAYDNIDDFLDALWETIEIYVPNYMARKQYYSQLLAMSDKELLSLGDSINNITEWNNDVVDNPLDQPLKNITSQNSSRTYADPSNRIRYQIHTAQFTLEKDFLDKFRFLFVRMFTLVNYCG